MILLGAAGGDIAGSRFEFDNYRAKDFELFSADDFFTDDTVMTMAVASAIINTPNLDELGRTTVREMQAFGRMFPGRGYGGNFGIWINEPNPRPYNSFGNGSAMRVSACGWAADSLEQAKLLARKVTEVTHNHPEGIKGAEAVACAIYLAQTGTDIKDIGDFIKREYYQIDYTLSDIRSTYKFNETCQNTVPQAIEAFLESTSYEDALRNAVSVGGDSDTLAAITGSIAEAYFGIPQDMQLKIQSYFGEDKNGHVLEEVAARFSELYG